MLRRIRAVLPSGAFSLAGYSAGGHIAHEIARRLDGLGQRPPHLFLIDTMVPGSLLRRSPRRAAGIVARYLVGLGLRDAIRFLRERALRKARVTSAGLRRRLGLEGPGAGDPTAAIRLNVFEATLRAVAAYRPGPYPGSAVLLVGNDHRVAHGFFRESPPLNGWGGLIRGGLVVHEVPGTHWTVLEQADGGRIGERISALLQEAPTP